MGSKKSDIATEERELTGTGQAGGAPRRVFVTGAGPVCPVALGIAEFSGWLWDGGLCGARAPEVKDGVARMPQFDLADFTQTTRPYVDPNTRFALASAALALSCSAQSTKAVDPARSGLCTATVFGNMTSLGSFQQTVRQKGVRLASPALFPHCYANTTNSLLCIEFDLRGYNQNFCDDALGGARSVHSAFHAIKSGLADLILAGGVDALSDRLAEVLPLERAVEGGPPVSEGACLLCLENEFSILQRESTAACELMSMASRGTGLVRAPADEAQQARLAEAIRGALSDALRDARMWEGDLGALFVATPRSGKDLLSQAGTQALADFSQLPTFSVCSSAGDTFAAAFPFECAAAALLLTEGALPVPPELEKVQKGVEMWLEKASPSMLGDGVVVLGWSAAGAVAALLKAV